MYFSGLVCSISRIFYTASVGAFTSDKIYYIVSVILYVIVVLCRINLLLTMFRAVQKHTNFLTKRYSTNNCTANEEASSFPLNREAMRTSFRKAVNLISREKETNSKSWSEISHQERGAYSFDKECVFGSQNERRTPSCQEGILVSTRQRSLSSIECNIFSTRLSNPTQKMCIIQEAGRKQSSTGDCV